MQSLQKRIASLAASLNIEYIQIVLHRREEKTLKRERSTHLVRVSREFCSFLFAQKCERSRVVTLNSSQNDDAGILLKVRKEFNPVREEIKRKSFSAPLPTPF